MQFESGALSEVWANAQVRAAAAKFERILIRVPEGYAVVRDYEATRPGVLWLDGSGRKLGIVALTGKDTAGYVTDVLAGAEAALAVGAGRGTPPTATEIAFPVDPMPDAKAGDAAVAALRATAGVWDVRLVDGRCTFVTSRLYADPAGLAEAARKAGLAPGAASHAIVRVPVETLPDTPSALKPLRAIEQQPGVVAALADLARREVRVLYRPDASDAAKIRAAAVGAGLVPRADAGGETR